MFIASLLLAALAVPAPSQDAVSEARDLYQSGATEDALDLLSDALRDAPADSAVRLQLAEYLSWEGRASEAVEVLGELDASEHDVALALGRAYSAWANQLAYEGASGDDVQFTLMDAKSHYEHAVEAAPEGDHRARLDLGYLELYSFSDYQRAFGLADEPLSNGTADPELQLLRGCAGVHVYWNKKQSDGPEAATAAWQQAVDDLQAADEALPKERTQPLGQLAWLYEDKGDAMRAVECAIEIVDRQQEPQFDALYEMAKRAAYGRNFEASGRALEKIVQVSARELTVRILREDDKTDVALNLGYSHLPYSNRNDNATARMILAAITNADPESADVWYNYGVACETTSRFEDAIKAYERTIELAPDDPRPYNDLAKVLHIDLNRDLDRAKDLYAQCVEVADEHLAMVDTTPEWRNHCSAAKNLAQTALNQLAPPTTASSTLSRLLEGLEGLGELAGESDADGDTEGDGDADTDEGGDEANGDGGPR